MAAGLPPVHPAVQPAGAGRALPLPRRDGTSWRATTEGINRTSYQWPRSPMKRLRILPEPQSMIAITTSTFSTTKAT